MTELEVNSVKSGGFGEHGGRDVIGHDAIQFRAGEYWRARISAPHTLLRRRAKALGPSMTDLHEEDDVRID